MSDAYLEFLQRKVVTAPARGFEISGADVNPACKPHVRAIVPWMVRLGRAACFSRFGLQKTVTQLEVVRLTRERAGGRGLIVCPLGARQEFRRDAVERLGWAAPPRFIRSTAEAEDPEGLYLTNYESVREGKIDPLAFTVASLDEAAVLRGFGGTKTFREFMALFAGDDRSGVRTRGVPYRYVATATPSPNDFIELLAYAAYLDVMDVSAAKTRFFKRNSEKADQLTLHPHKEREFWLWVASWAIFLQRPSDLGPEYSDEGYDLPPLDVRWHEVPTDHSQAGAEKDGQGRMFKDSAVGVVDASREKRASLPARVAKLLELRAEDPTAHRVLWHDLEAERDAIEDALPAAAYGAWLEFKDGNSQGIALYERHYSAHHYADGRERKLFAGPGHKTVLLTQDGAGLFVWRKFIDDSGQQGVNCAVFRNEGALQSSDLIREAMAIAWMRWPGERLYTYVDPEEVRSSNPGYCFLMAGWMRAGVTKGGLLILEALPGLEVPSVERRPVLKAVYGTQDLDEREAAVQEFAEGRLQEIAAKPVMLGAGINIQRHCHWAIYLGIGWKFADFIQSLHRLQRYGQTCRVRVDLIFTEAERKVRQDLERKWRQHEQLVENMSRIIREFGLAHASITSALTRSMGVPRVEASGPGYRLVNNDAVLELPRVEADSVGLVVTSIPFANQYEYSPSFHDFGHTDDFGHFWRQMDFLTPELLRVLQPGRVAAVHVKDRITPGGINGYGFQTVHPLSDECVAHFKSHGFAFLGRKTVVTDVVRENAQTYRLGWTEQCKDGSRMGAGLPEYVLLFRKPQTDRSRGFADLPVVKAKEKYSRGRWQFDAHGFTRSKGDRPITTDDLKGLTHAQVFQLFRKHSLTQVYDFQRDVSLAEWLDAHGMLPPSFMLMQPQSWHPDVWTDIARMRTANMHQVARGAETHLCPLQFDIVDRLVEQFSMPGELVLDPFVGLGTVVTCAVKLGRRGLGVELCHRYYLDACAYAAAAAREASMPTLFDLVEQEAHCQ